VLSKPTIEPIKGYY